MRAEDGHPGLKSGAAKSQSRTQSKPAFGGLRLARKASSRSVSVDSRTFAKTTQTAERSEEADEPAPLGRGLPLSVRSGLCCPGLQSGAAHLALVIAIMAIAVLAPSPAAAFCRTMSTKVSPDFVPSVDRPCWDQGVALYWANRCVGYSLQRDASRQVSYDDVTSSLTAAFTRWASVSCPTKDGSAQVSIDIRYLGPVSCGRVQYNQDPEIGNANVIMFRDDVWPHNDANNTLGLTTVTYNPKTGELYDADMEINSANVKLVTRDPVPQDGYDFASILTHETGHFLGMAHSPDTRATMYASYKQGSTTMRYLATDDVAGICTGYPPDGTRGTSLGSVKALACDPTPRHGYASECIPTAATKSCAVAPPGENDRTPLFVLAPVAIALIRRIRKPRR